MGELDADTFDRLTAATRWPTKTHRRIAQALCVGNSAVPEAEKALALVAAILTVPVERIDTLTMRQLQDEFKAPMFAALAEPKKETLQ